MNKKTLLYKVGFILAVNLFVCTNASARTHIVLVRDNSFSPATVVIEAGDTVRWVNEGPGAHNIFSQGRFRCANGCEAEGGDGSASADPWEVEITFRKPETIPYECQPHVQFGMVGTVVVQVPTTGTIHQIDAEVDNTFNPDNLTIRAGDVVLLRNAGGEHNIQSDDANFTCADGCEGDGLNVNTAPTGFPWEIYYRFSEPGALTYQCTNPAHSTQTGLLQITSDVFFKNGFE